MSFVRCSVGIIAWCTLMTTSALGCTAKDIEYLIQVINPYQCAINDRTIVCSTIDRQVLIPIGDVNVAVGAYQIGFTCKLGACLTEIVAHLGSDNTQSYSSNVLFYSTWISEATRNALNLCFNGPPPPPVYPWPQQNDPNAPIQSAPRGLPWTSLPDNK